MLTSFTICFLISIIIVFSFWVVSLRRVVPTNMVHIVQSGKETKSYGKGKSSGNSYYQWPTALPKIGVTVTTFPESVFDVSLKDYEAYDQGRLPFMVDIMAFFRIEDSDCAAHRVSSFQELHTQLMAVLQGAVRRILGTNNLESILSDRSKLGAEFTTEVNEQLKEWGVTTVKSIEFMDIRDSRDSQVIANIMAKEKSRISMESRTVVADNSRAAQLAEIEAKQQVQLREQESQQQVGMRTAEKDKQIGIAQEQAQQEVKTQAKVTAEKDMAVLQVQQVTQANINKEVAVVTAQQAKEVQVTKAEGDLEASKREAEGVTVKGEAEGKAKLAVLMAPVDSQIALAKEIGENANYQQYLLTLEQIKVSGTVGEKLAEALGAADLKVIANSGDIQSGVTSLGDMFSAKGGTNLSAMLTAFSQTEQGKAIVDKLTSKKSEELVSE